MKEVLERCAGLDVHKKTITACIMVGLKGDLYKDIKTFKTTTSDIKKLLCWLKSHDIKNVAMESTGVYWKPVFNVLERETNILLANPKHMKNIPGKKTDVKDAEWICTLLKYNLLNASFIPCRSLRNLRDLTRLRKKIVQERTTATNRIIKQLESCNIKLKSVVSSIRGKSAWNIVQAISNGITDSHVLAGLVSTRVKASREEVIDALDGKITNHEIMMINLLVKRVEFYEEEICTIDDKIAEAKREFNQELNLIQSIPGVGEKTSEVIIAEIGTDMDQFITENHLTSWAGLVPGNNESAGKMKSSRIRPGNNHLRIALIQCAWSAVKEKNGYWQAMYYRLKFRLGAKKAIVAIARKMLKAIYMSIKFGKAYCELGYKKNDPDKINRSIEYHKRKLEQLSSDLLLANA